MAQPSSPPYPDGPAAIVPWGKLREPVSSLTHAFGAVVALVCTAVLAVRAGAGWPPYLVFGASMTLLHAASAVYHAVRASPRSLVWWRKLDHGAIFLLIAGTYTPVLSRGLIGSWQSGMLAAVWGIAALGVGLKLFVRLPRWTSTLLYLGMGWLAVLVLPQLWASLPAGALIALVAGGLFYTAGAIVYATRRFNPWPGVLGFHEVWHLFVLAGSAAHLVMAFRLAEG